MEEEEDIDALSSQQMVWKCIISPVSIIPLATLVEDNVDDLFMLANVFGSVGHDIIYHFAEEINVAARVFLNFSDQLGDCAFVLEAVDEQSME